MRTGEMTLKQAALKLGFVTEDEVDRFVDPAKDGPSVFPRSAEQQPVLHIGEKKFGGMTVVTVHHEGRNGLLRIAWASASGAGLALAALASYELTTRILTSEISSRDDQMLGGMWSVVATLFVFRQSYNESVSAALSRTAATSLSFILCLGYLLLLPFSSWGMTILIVIGAVILIMIDRPGDVVTTSITTTVVMVVAGISP